MRIEWNKVTWYSRLLAIGVFLVVFILGIYLGIGYKTIEDDSLYLTQSVQKILDVKESSLGTQSTDRSTPITVNSSTTQANNSGQYKPRCVDYPDYFVVTKSTNSVGDDIVIKYKSSYKGTNISCVFVVGPGDYVIGGAESAEYFLKIIDHFAITDIGTSASQRSFAVYDLNTRKVVFVDSDMRGNISVTDDSITYFSPTKITASLQNCKQLNEFYGSALIAVQMKVYFADLIKRDLGIYECFMRE